MAMYLAKLLTSHSYSQIGESFGNRDHTTVLHACKTIEQMLSKCKDLRDDLETLQQQLSN